MVSKKMRKVWLILTLCMTLVFGSSINAYAYVDESADTESTTEAVVVEEELTVDTEKESEEETTEDTLGMEQDGAFSESGNLSLLDDVGTDEAKELEYMTVQTKSGAVFYLVIDRSADTENVYFLNQVDELDLMAIMDDAQKTEYENSVAEKEETATPDVTEEPSEPVEEVPEEKTEIQTVNPAVFGVIGVAAIAIIGGYMFMKKKSKKDDAGLEEDLEFYDDEEYENEDDVEEQEIEFIDLEEEEK